MMYKYEDIKTVHLEITDKCNAACPQCSRNINGGKVNPLLPLTELSLNDIQKIFEPDFIKRLHRLYMCGNYGDPIVASDTIYIFNWLLHCNNNIHLAMFTNGSGRNKEWWNDLGKILNSEHRYVRFAIDGLEDTNHIYRRGTYWNKIMDSINAFISAGGAAEWDFVVFKHNEHQVEEAEELSKKLGFKKFTAKRTNRFYDTSKMKPLNYFQVLDRHGNEDYKIYPPKNKRYQNNKIVDETTLLTKYGTMDSYLDQAVINCKVKDEKSIFVSSEGLVFPCCWTAMQLYQRENSIQQEQIKNITIKDGINAKFNRIKDIINGPLFNNIEKSWSKDSINDGKLKICSRICGTENDSFKEMFNQK